jgi:RNA polymerase sigma-70 factor (ECF subfamily)
LHHSDATTPSPIADDRQDAEVVVDARRDPSEFSTLFDRYWDSVFGYCFLRVGNWHEAEDVASQVFLSALANLSHFESQGTSDTFRAWLFGIARNHIGTSFRNKAKHAAAPIDEATAVFDQRGMPEELFIAAEEHELLLDMLSQLSPDQRELLQLRLAGLSAAEIGRVLGKSQDAVRKAQSRTVIGLRAELAKRQSRQDGQRHV